MDRLGLEPGPRGIRHLARLFFRFLRRGSLGLGGRRAIVVVGVEPGDFEHLELDVLEVASVLDAAVGRERPLAQDDVIPLEDRTEIVEGDLVEMRVALERHAGLREEIGIALDFGAPAAEDDRFGENARRILPVLRADVAHVVGLDLELRHFERPGAAAVQVAHRAVVDAKEVDLERVDFLQSLLPAVLGHRRRILRFLLEMVPVHVEHGIVKVELRDQASVQERRPLEIRPDVRKRRDRRFGMRVLDELHVVEVHREHERVEMRAAERRRIALEPRVHPALHVERQRAVGQI